MVTFKKYSCFLLITFLSACAYPKLSFVRKDNVTNKFRLDGFYYSSESVGDVVFDGCGAPAEPAKASLFMFGNGLFKIHAALRNPEEMLEHYKWMKEERGHDRNKDGWGIYRVEKDSMPFEYWYIQETPQIEKGYFKIINDTTLYEATVKDGKIVYELTYKFYKTDWKPDSIPDFYKDLDVKRKSQY